MTALQTVTGAVLNRGINTADPKYDARPDGTDQTSNLQAAFDSGETVIYIKPGTYEVSGLLSINNPCTIFAYDVTFNWDSSIGTTANQGLRIFSSNVKIYGLTVDGPQYLTRVTTQSGIRAEGTDSETSGVPSTYINNVRLYDCTVTNWAFYGIVLEFVEKFTVRDCFVQNAQDGGIFGLSARKGKVSYNEIDNIVNFPAWGISMTRNNAGDTVRRPLPERIEINGNDVTNVQLWTGIDSHGGNRINIHHNTVVDCFRGCTLAVFDNTGDGGSDIWAPRDSKINHNTMRNENIVSTAMGAAISVSGNLAAFGQRNSVIGNTAEGFGDSDNTPDGTNSPSVLILHNAALNMDANTLENSGLVGVSLFGMGEDNYINGTIIRDITGTNGQAYRIDASGQVSEIFITGGVVDVAGHTAVFCEEAAQAHLGNIRFKAYSNITDHTGGATIAGQYLRQWLPVITDETTWNPPSIAAGGSDSVTVSNVPGCSGASSVEVSFNRDLQGLTYNVDANDTDKNVGSFTIYLYNNTSGAIDLDELTIKYKVELRRP